VAHTLERLFGSVGDSMTLQRAHYSGENPSRWTRYALFDAWAIHLAHAMHFARPRAAQPTDIVAADYFDGDRWAEIIEQTDAGDWPAMLDEVKVKQWIENELLHLRYDRIHSASESGNWPLAPVTAHLARDLQAFVDNVAAELVADDFAVRAQNALDSLH
jgi:hypothetical protein